MSVLSEELALRLQAIFKEFVLGKIPRDDTLLEKTLSWLQQILCDSDSCEQFLSSTNFVGCLNGICFQSEVDSHIWTFLLRLSGYVAGKFHESRSAPNSFTGVVQKIFSETTRQSHLWSQASIRCAWLKGLQLQAANHRQFNKADACLMLQCLDDGSWFVSKAAVSVLAEFVCTALKSSDADDIVRDVIDYLLGSLDLTDQRVEMTKCRFTASMEILESICAESLCYDALCRTISQRSLVGPLCLAIGSTAADKTNDRCSAVLRVLSALWRLDKERDEIFDKLTHTSQKMLLLSHLAVAMETAAWILERGTYKTSRESICVMLENICLIPLWLSVRPEAMEKDFQQLLQLPLSSDCWRSISRLMSQSKGSHTSLVKSSLTLLIQMKECLVQRIVVFDLLKDVLLQATDQCPARQPLLLITNRLKHQCFDVLLCLIAECQNMGKVSEAFIRLVITFLHEPHHDQVTVSKAFSVLIEFLKIFGSGSHNEANVLLDKLPVVLERTINSVNWDVRDTALNFITRLLSMCTEVNVLSRWAQDSNVIQYISGSLKDGESFVRASALYALGAVSESVLFDSEEIRSHVKKFLWLEVLSLCQQDAKTFSRRAAIELVARWYHSQFMHSEKVTLENVLFLAVNDADWEIKIKAVEFWDAFAQDLFQRHCSTEELSLGKNSTKSSWLIERLTRSGCVKALLTACQDCDRAVQLHGLKALKSIITQCSVLCSQNFCEQNGDSVDGVWPVNAVETGNDLKKFSDCFLADATDGKDSEAVPADQLLRHLSSIELNPLIACAEQSTDGHDSQPESLLEDLTKSLVMPLAYGSGFTSSEEDDDDDLAADCY